MKKLKNNKKKNCMSFSYTKKSKNEIINFYSEWEKFQKVIQPAS